MTGSGSGNVLAACEMPSSRKLKCRVEKVMTVVNFAPVVCELSWDCEMQNENAKELSLLSALLFSSLFWCNLRLRFNSISPAGQRYAHPLPDNTYTQRMCSATCSCRWAWTNSESFSRAHATCLSAALGSAHTVRISIRPVGCSLLHTCTPSHNATAAWPGLAWPKPLLMLAGIRWRAYSQIDGSRGAAAGEGGGGGEPRWIVCNGQVAGTGCAALSVAKFRTTFIIFGLGQREFSRQFKVQH